MKAKDFLREFEDAHFPRVAGPWIGLDAHDPPFSRSQIKKMAQQGLIIFNSDESKYRLTFKAAKLRTELV